MTVLEKFLEYCRDFNEMSWPCQKADGYGIIIAVYARDHGNPHAHLFDTNQTLVAKFLITDERPTKPQHIQYLKVFDARKAQLLRQNICDFAVGRVRVTGADNWLNLRDQWDRRRSTPD